MISWKSYKYKMPAWKISLPIRNLLCGNYCWFWYLSVFFVIIGMHDTLNDYYSFYVLCAVGIPAARLVGSFLFRELSIVEYFGVNKDDQYERFVTKYYPEYPELSREYVKQHNENAKEKWKNNVRNFHLYNHQNHFDEKCFVCVAERDKYTG